MCRLPLNPLSLIVSIVIEFDCNGVILTPAVGDSTFCLSAPAYVREETEGYKIQRGHGGERETAERRVG